MYLFHISLHGLVRSKDIELGRNSDTGGQITYVLNLLDALSAHDEVTKVELATRGFQDSSYDADYRQPKEVINNKAAILRFFDDEPAYLPKEALWDKLPLLKKEIITYLQAQPKLPDVIHAHYADAGKLGAEIAKELNIPFLFTGHSLGRTKLAAYEEQGWDAEQIEENFNITKRITAEEIALREAKQLIASSSHELEQQYADYYNFDQSKANILAPGYDPAVVKRNDDIVNPRLLKLINRFLAQPSKPAILALSRPSSKKNLATLVQAYAEYPGLKDMANLVIFAGQRDDISESSPDTKAVFEELFYLIDRHDLYGHVAMPKKHRRRHVADIYAYAAQTRGVFANIAYEENFGLTAVEAAANGLPVVVTNNGGTVDIVQQCQHGETVDPNSPEEIGKALFSLISDSERWESCSQNGRHMAQNFAWHQHAANYLKLVQKVTSIELDITQANVSPANVTLANVTLAPQIITSKMEHNSPWLVISDIDHTLTGSHDGVEALHRLMDEYKGKLTFAVATGRSLKKTLEAVDEWRLPFPKAILASVGSEIFYEEKGTLTADNDWNEQLKEGWQRHAVEQAMAGFPELILQPSGNQANHKLSYYIEEEFADVAAYKAALAAHKLKANVIYSHSYYLDILPPRASKRYAASFLTQKLGIDPERVITVGDSGNDYDMLAHSSNAIMVANYCPELVSLTSMPHVYVAKDSYADGVAEGLRYILER